MDTKTIRKHYCMHNKKKYECKECDGSIFCCHGKNKYSCKDCGGSQICVHGKNKRICKECNGAAFCSHGRQKYRCKDCKGSAICLHGSIKYFCKDCNGNQLCSHGRYKRCCKECGGSEICIHKINKRLCKNCDGRAYCQHDVIKSRCPDCNGNEICKARHEPYKTSCITMGNPRLDNFCSHCFANLFPDDPRVLTIKRKSKELQVVSHILSKYEGFIHDRTFSIDLHGGCCATKRRIDLRKLINNTLLCIEIDEDQHKTYIKEHEIVRYDDLFMDFSGKYIFIRYNPDKFKDKYGKSKNPYLYKRMEVLENVINKHSLRIQADGNDDLVEIHHVFYDEI